MILEKGLFEKPVINLSTPVVEMIKDFISWQLEHKCPLTWSQWVWRDW
jgi:hypothetical protein